MSDGLAATLASSPASSTGVACAASHDGGGCSGGAVPSPPQRSSRTRPLLFRTPRRPDRPARRRPEANRGRGRRHAAEHCGAGSASPHATSDGPSLDLGPQCAMPYRYSRFTSAAVGAFRTLGLPTCLPAFYPSGPLADQRGPDLQCRRGGLDRWLLHVWHHDQISDIAALAPPAGHLAPRLGPDPSELPTTASPRRPRRPDGSSVRPGWWDDARQPPPAAIVEATIRDREEQPNRS